MRKKIIAIFVFFLLLVTIQPVLPTHSQSETDKLRELAEKISEYERQIKDLQSKSTSLTNQIAQFDAQIRLTELKIDQTEEQITLLTGRIDQLSLSLNNLNNAYNSRVVETYKLGRVGESPLTYVLGGNIDQALSRYHYLKRIQEADQTLLGRLTKANDTYKSQKNELETLQEELEVQKGKLDGQKIAKAQLLTVTKNDEKKYQSLLAASRAEFEAIQAIISGKGDETEVGDIQEGQKVAAIIQGASCNSSAAHLHFIVAKGNQTQNPFSYLKPGIEHNNCTGGGECSGADPFNPSGSWNWPIAPTVRYNQGYGRTWAVANTWVGRIYSQHNGIDINSTSSPEVKAVRPGKLFRGSYTGSGGCRLRYVRVDHSDSDLDTYYLHINY